MEYHTKLYINEIHTIFTHKYSNLIQKTNQIACIYIRQKVDSYFSAASIFKINICYQ